MESIRLRRGFTLVELMVVLAIIVVLTTVILTNQSSFNKTLILSNTAYDIALTLRSAETYGIGSRAAGTAANVGYGVHLSSGTNNSFLFFADTHGGVSCSGLLPSCKPGDHVYTTDDTLVQTYKLNNGIVIHDFCAYSAGSWSCAADGGISSLDVVFSRPSPEPFMSKSGSYSEPPFSVTAACFSVASPSAPNGPYRYITIGSSGQIIANATSCP